MEPLLTFRNGRQSHGRNSLFTLFTALYLAQTAPNDSDSLPPISLRDGMSQHVGAKAN
jgi:hypothetical protein